MSDKVEVYLDVRQSGSCAIEDTRIEFKIFHANEDDPNDYAAFKYTSWGGAEDLFMNPESTSKLFKVSIQGVGQITIDPISTPAPSDIKNATPTSK